MANQIVSDTTATSADGSTVETVTFADGSRQIRYTPGPGTSAANAQALQAKAQAALTANAADIAQDQTLMTQAATVTATSGTLTTTQLSNMVRQLAQAVATLAANDTNRAKEVNALIRLALGQLDTTDGT